MAGRCAGCSSTSSTGAAATGADCATVTGAGTPASPFVVGVEVDPDADNRLSCGPSGLYAEGSTVGPGDGIDVTGSGTLIAPFLVEVVPDPATPLVTVSPTGLAVESDTVMHGVGNSLLGGAAPAVGAGGWLAQAGTSVVVTDANGDATITLPAAFPTGMLTAVVCSGAQVSGGTGFAPIITIQSGTETLNSFVINCTYSDGTSIIGGSVRANFAAWGW